MAAFGGEDMSVGVLLRSFGIKLTEDKIVLVEQALVEILCMDSIETLSSEDTSSMLNH